MVATAAKRAKQPVHVRKNNQSVVSPKAKLGLGLTGVLAMARDPDALQRLLSQSAAFRAQCPAKGLITVTRPTSPLD
jgi:hypothetical protein